MLDAPVAPGARHVCARHMRGYVFQCLSLSRSRPLAAEPGTGIGPRADATRPAENFVAPNRPSADCPL